MVTRPQGTGCPTHAPGRSDPLIVGDRVVAGVVQVVRPLVDLRRPRLHHFRPAAVGLDAGDGTRGQNTHHLRMGYAAEVFGDNEVDEVVGVGKPAAVEPVMTRPPQKRAISALVP